MRKFSIFLVLVFLLPKITYGQSLLDFKRHVQNMPLACEIPEAETMVLGTEKKRGDLPWIVFSDRAENLTYTRPGGTLVMNKLNFMEPFFVSETKNGYVKLLKYKEGIVRGRKIVDRKAVVSCGWIAADKLLLWQRAYTDSRSGYVEKALTIISGKGPLMRTSSFFDTNDSVYVFSDPDMTTRFIKLKLGQIVYVYKTSIDGNKLLIGKDEQLFPDEAKATVFGWIDRDIVAPWGKRLFLGPKKAALEDIQAVADSTINSASQYSFHHHASNFLLESDPPSFHGYPILNQRENSLEIAIVRDVYDRAKNAVTTLNGTSLSYPQYGKLRKSLRNVNVIFVIEGGAGMSRYFGGLINTLQHARTIFQQYSQAYKFRYGAIVYRNAPSLCHKDSIRSFSLNQNYNIVLDSLKGEIPGIHACTYSESAQPLGDALDAATAMLKEKSNETNLIVLLGNTGDDRLKLYNVRLLSEKMAKRDVKLLAIQLYSRRDDLFNDFIVQSRQLISTSAVTIAAKKRATMVRGEALQTAQRFDMRLADSNSFFLDYPKSSLLTGGVVYPSLGEVKSTKLVIASLARFITDNIRDIQDQITTLDSAFRLEGTEWKKLNPAVVHELGVTKNDSTITMPHNLYQFYSKVPLDHEVWKPHKDLFEYILILSAREYKELYDNLLLMRGWNLQADNQRFRSKLYKNYLYLAKKRLLLRLPPKVVKKMTLATYFSIVSGLPVENERWCKYRIKDIKSNMPNDDFEWYLNALIQDVDRINIKTGMAQHFSSNGQIYYIIRQSDIERAGIDRAVVKENK